jgi:hypothetical protein
MHIGAYLLVLMYVHAYSTSIHHVLIMTLFPKRVFNSHCILMFRYDGSVGSASQAMVTVDQFQWHFNRRNL